MRLEVRCWLLEIAQRELRCLQEVRRPAVAIQDRQTLEEVTMKDKVPYLFSCVIQQTLAAVITFAIRGA